MKFLIGRAIGISVMAACLAACGDVSWFPENETSTTSSADSNNNNQADSPTNLTVSDSTGKTKATNLIVAEVSRSSTYVTVSAKVDVTNSDSTQKNVYIEIAGKDSAGLEKDSIWINAYVNAAETKTLTETTVVELAIYPTISTWSIKSVNAYSP